ncbi:MAG: hypothetical protein IPP29_22975 [Bacteroidetes bacterium]|nr:hypothetical protein [Bacteroidota bacterium]
MGQNTLTGVRRVGVGGCPFVFTNNDATLPGIRLGLITGSQCISPRIPVVAVVNTAPPMATTMKLKTICEASCDTLNVDASAIANYHVFNWSPATD